MYLQLVKPPFYSKKCPITLTKALKQPFTKHQHYIVTVNHLIHLITTHNIEMSNEKTMKSKMTNI